MKTLHVVSSLVPLTPTPALTDWLSPVVLMIGQILHILAVLTCTNILTLLFSNLTVGQRPKPSALPVLPRFTSSLTSLVLMSVVCLWFPLFQKDSSPHLRLCPDLCPAPPRLGLSPLLFCTLPDDVSLAVIVYVLVLVLVLDADFHSLVFTLTATVRLTSSWY